MIQEHIQNDIKNALRAKESERLSTLRMIFSAIQTRQIEKRSKTGVDAPLTDNEVIAVLRQEAKKRSDAAREFSAAGRSELAEKEKAELAVLRAYLPKEMDDEALEGIVKKTITGMGAVSGKDFGKVMGAVMKEAKGAASGERVSAMVKKILGSS